MRCMTFILIIFFLFQVQADGYVCISGDSGRKLDNARGDLLRDMKIDEQFLSDMLADGVLDRSSKDAIQQVLNYLERRVILPFTLTVFRMISM